MKINSPLLQTLSAITDITINYLVNDSIRDVIHDRALMKYNEIFRFLLQVKWAIWTLETLQFPVGFKKRPPYQQLTLIDLIFKRLALVRNWIIYSVQCVHSHLMTLVIQSMGQQLVKRIKKSECLREIIELHDSYIDTIYQHCFRKTSDIPLKSGLEQLLSLVVILRDEWNNLHNVNSQGDFVDGENTFDVGGTVQQVDVIEATYINCHCHIAEVLTREVYSKDQTTRKYFTWEQWNCLPLFGMFWIPHLSEKNRGIQLSPGRIKSSNLCYFLISVASLSAAFNCSCPY